MTELSHSRCRRCGTEVADADHEFTHYLFVRLDEGTQTVALRMCGRCARDFPSFRERDEYARASFIAG